MLSILQSPMSSVSMKSSSRSSSSTAALTVYCTVLPTCVCSRQEVTDVYSTPLMELVYSAATVHRMYNDPTMVSSWTSGSWNSPLLGLRLVSVTAVKHGGFDLHAFAQRPASCTATITFCCSATPPHFVGCYAATLPHFVGYCAAVARLLTVL